MSWHPSCFGKHRLHSLPSNFMIVMFPLTFVRIESLITKSFAPSRNDRDVVGGFEGVFGRDGPSTARPFLSGLNCCFSFFSMSGVPWFLQREHVDGRTTVGVTCRNLIGISYSSSIGHGHSSAPSTFDHNVESKINPVPSHTTHLN